jgi:hypothetical protein
MQLKIPMDLAEELRFTMRKQPLYARYLRWSYELLLSLYYVLMCVVGTFSFSQFTTDVSRLLHHGIVMTDVSFRDQYISWFLLAGVVFIVLRILGQFRELKTFLCQLVGAAVFLVPHIGIRPGWAIIPSWWSWLWVVDAIAVGAALLYTNRRRPATTAFFAVAALFHFALWASVYFPGLRLTGFSESFTEFVLLPLFGSLAWGFYVWLHARPNPAERHLSRR